MIGYLHRKPVRFLPYDILQLGDPGRFAQRCEDYQASHGGGGFGNYGAPGANGTVYENEIFNEDFTGYWPHYLLKGKSLEFAISLPLDAILDFTSFLDLGSLFGGGIGGILGAIGFTGGGLTFSIDMDISNPVPICLFIETVFIRVVLASNEAGLNNPNAAELRVYNTQNIPLIDLTGAGQPGYNPQDPYDYRYNSYYNWHTPHPVTLHVYALIPLDGELQALLLDLLFNGIWLKVTDLVIWVIIPNTLSYRLELVIDLGDLSTPMFMDPLL